jgi:hypothetical protein
MNPRDLDRLVGAIADAPRERVLEAVAPHLEQGLPWEELEAAVFLAGVHHVRPRPVGFKLHCAERLLPVLWNLDDFKASQARDVAEGDWRLSPAPAVEAASPQAAARELVAALDAADDERADRAVVSAAATLELGELFELLWPYAIRDFSNLGHKPIYASHVARVLRRMGGVHAVPALRALVHGLLDGAPGERLEEYEESVRLAARIRDGWTDGERRPERSLELARGIRAASSAGARELVVEALNEGLSELTVWDGIRLGATDLFARRPSLLPVHPTTVSSALFHVHRNTASEATRRLALLQAASWLPLYRERLFGDLGADADTGGIEAFLVEHDHALPTVDELFRAPTTDLTHACLTIPGNVEPFTAALRTHLYRGAREHHQPKYAAVLLEDLRTADPRWHPVLLAATLDYLPAGPTRETRIHAESRELVARIAR